jgi:hypothetical protein
VSRPFEATLLWQSAFPSTGRPLGTTAAFIDGLEREPVHRRSVKNRRSIYLAA